MASGNRSGAQPELALGARDGLPEDLRVLRERYPREMWYDHANLGDMARFWLSRHDMFRELGDALQSTTVAFREGQVTARDYQAWFAPRLQFFLGSLLSHHRIEDHHYFPIFQAADQRLAHGFDLMESDHHVLHEAIGTSVEAANEFLRSLADDRDRLMRAAERYAAAGNRLLDGLIRHLDDEEDLIVPLILERGEQALGVAH